MCGVSQAYKRGQQITPPEPEHTGYYVSEQTAKEIENKVSTWDPSKDENAWEMSGLIEGDILPPSGDLGKNGLRGDKYRWKDGIVPYFITELEFSDENIEKVLDAIQEYHNKTCIRFRPFRLTDRDFIMIRSSRPGCWSSVGRQSGGQVVNLQVPGCNHRGIIIHEFLHALGFFHQQSAADRDDHVKIHWENIQEGRENNFEKYNDTVVTSYEQVYDYTSIMHYSSKAFSKNGEVTIEPLQAEAKIGQRDHLSDADIAKLNAMYKTECENRENNPEPEFSLTSWLFQ
ncbi:zinc metalloproteinase nas-13-like [Ctenocephalides felis]|uniref:zinc metalloproteinase nas-13-like n=1 Tax=Ctenocephalides felis TaxID=7515 RepID=UPI000E6E4ABD|nr:zinc metalloproteinase nas-13-like [Ctenocephalides felis]